MVRVYEYSSYTRNVSNRGKGLSRERKEKKKKEREKMTFKY